MVGEWGGGVEGGDMFKGLVFHTKGIGGIGRGRRVWLDAVLPTVFRLWAWYTMEEG